MKIKNINKYLSLYSTENFLFNKLGPEIKSRGYLIFDDFYKICMWKSRRPKNLYLKNISSVSRITKLALKEKDEIKRMEILCGLSGVSVPVASAILTVVYPTKYGIIDIRCLEMLNILGERISTNSNINTWIKFISVMRKIAKENNVTPREVDMVLFAMHREKLDNENYKSLYKKY